MDSFNNMINQLNSLVWSNALVALCLGAGVYFSIRMKFPQIRLFKDMFQLLLKVDPDSESGITPFQAFATTVGSRVGMGSVAGVATAIYFGGPGALLWMGIVGLFGAAIALVEATLAQAYKTKINGEYVGGSALYIEKGLKLKLYAVIFVVATVLGPGVLMPGMHANSIASTFQRSFGTSMLVGGIILTVLLGVVIFGGVKRIGKFAEKAAPSMCLIYMIMALGIVVLNLNKIPAVIYSVFSSAFGMDAVFGGIVGSAIIWGVKRGMYSTDAGVGFGGILSATAEVSHPAKQGLVQALSVYIVSFIVCPSTAIILLLSNSYNVIDATTGKTIVEYLPGSQYGVGWTQDVLESTYGAVLGGKLFAVIIALFVFTSLIGYGYVVESSISWLTKGNKLAINIFRAVFVASTFSGVLVNADIVWTMGDIGGGLMTWLNIIALLLLSKQGLAIFRDYEMQKKQGKNPVFCPDQFGIKDEADIWRKKNKK